MVGGGRSVAPACAVVAGVAEDVSLSASVNCVVREDVSLSASVNCVVREDVSLSALALTATEPRPALLAPELERTDAGVLPAVTSAWVGAALSGALCSSGAGADSRVGAALRGALCSSGALADIDSA